MKFYCQISSGGLLLRPEQVSVSLPHDNGFLLIGLYILHEASIMHALNIPDQYIMAQGGWKNDKVLKTIYQNTLPDYQKKFFDTAAKHFEEINTGTIQEMQHGFKNDATRNATRNKKSACL